MHYFYLLLRTQSVPSIIDLVNITPIQYFLIALFCEW
jgi:hypothetical protein